MQRIKLILLSIIIISITSCKEEMKKPVDDYKSEEHKSSFSAMDFNFTEELLVDRPDFLKVSGALYNSKQDTVYFLSTSCEGEQYSLIYDRLNLELAPQLLCNLSVLKIIKIAPKESHQFTAHFKYVDSCKNIKLGFDFYEVCKTFNIENAKNDQLKIYNRSPEKQNIIWAK